MDIIKEYFIEMEEQRINPPIIPFHKGDEHKFKLLEINKQNTYLEQKKIFNLE